MNRLSSSTRRQSRRSATAIGISTAALAVSLATASMVLAQISSPRGRNLIYPEYHEKAVLAGIRTNQLKGRLTLGEGEYLPNGLVFGKIMRLEQYTPEGNTSLVARAPECLFNPATRLAWSTGRLEITAMDGRFFIAGREGFEASLTNTTLILSNRVRTLLQQNLLTPTPP